MSVTEEQLNNLAKKAQGAFLGVNNLQELESIRVEYLGNKSELTQAQKAMGSLSKEEKPIFGKLINTTKNSITQAFQDAKNKLEVQALQEKLKQESIDVTLPGIPVNTAGNKHPLTLIAEEITDIFRSMGFEQLESPEIETDYYNFTALNTPESHPARDEQDTFYTHIADNVLLRSHVSPFQIRAIESRELPLRGISYGRVYRNEEINPRKLPFFHQLEAICIDENLNFGHLKWTLQTFFKQFFGDDVPIRLRPDFFPFTEPSAEVDAQCVFCKGVGCSTCGGKGWLELLGCGMIDTNVLENSGVDTQKYSGFALGLGLERFAMLKYNISDIRNFYTGDMRFLEQFAHV